LEQVSHQKKLLAFPPIMAKEDCEDEMPPFEKGGLGGDFLLAPACNQKKFDFQPALINNGCRR
jgi:hypothetical protein